MVRRTKKEESVDERSKHRQKPRTRGLAQLDVLNAKEIKILNAALEDTFGFTIPKSCTLIRGRKDKINIVNRDIERLNLDNLRIERAGLYFCTQDVYGVRLSIEGSQLFRKEITKNLLAITYPQLRLWLFGKDIELTPEQVAGKERGRFYVVHHQDDFCGCGRLRSEVGTSTAGSDAAAGRATTGRVTTGRVTTGRVTTGRVTTGRVTTGRVTTDTRDTRCVLQNFIPKERRTGTVE